MNLRSLLVLGAFVSSLLLAGPASGHIGSPDVFYEGKIGPYPANVTIRMPPVVPGRAGITVHVENNASLAVSFLPLFSRTEIKNAPPAELALPTVGMPGTYTGELWLMSVGAYGIEIRVSGNEGHGALRIPVNSVATHQLPLPPILGNILLALGGLLTFGCMAIVRAAVSESVLPPAIPMRKADVRKGLIAFGVTAVLLAVLLAGGWQWWKADEESFRRHLREGAWPDLSATVQSVDGQHVARLTLGEKAFDANYNIPLIPDHGKLLHVFLIGDPAQDVFGHLHPLRTGGKTFDMALPDFPPGDYRVFCDFTLDGSAVSSTATTTLQIPKHPVTIVGASRVNSDPDDSWSSAPLRSDTHDATDAIYKTADGFEVIWKQHPPLCAGRDAALQFEIRDPGGSPVELQSYMGMISHAAICRDDGKVFAHLHPSGNYSMAAQAFFEEKMAREAPGAGNEAAPMAGSIDHSKMGHSMSSTQSQSAFSLPYEFPSAGRYRIWVQFKCLGKVNTAVFETQVTPS